MRRLLILAAALIAAPALGLVQVAAGALMVQFGLFVAADVAHKVVGVALPAHRVEQDLRRALDHRVALQEAVTIVVGLEVVDVDVQQAPALDARALAPVA